MNPKPSWLFPLVWLGGWWVGCAGAPATHPSALTAPVPPPPAWLEQPCWRHFGDRPGAVLCGVGSAAGAADDPQVRAAARLAAQIEIGRVLTTSIAYLVHDATAADGRAVWEQAERSLTETALPRCRLAAEFHRAGVLYVLLVVDQDEPWQWLVGVDGLAGTDPQRAAAALERALGATESPPGPGPSQGRE